MPERARNLSGNHEPLARTPEQQYGSRERDERGEDEKYPEDDVIAASETPAPTSEKQPLSSATPIACRLDSIDPERTGGSPPVPRRPYSRRSPSSVSSGTRP